MSLRLRRSLSFCVLLTLLAGGVSFSPPSVVFPAPLDSPNAQGAAPVILNVTESASVGDIIGVQGANFGASPELWLMSVTGSETSLTPQLQLTLLTKSNTYVAARLPASLPQALYAVWVKNGTQLSGGALINRANPTSLLFAEIAPGQTFRIFGRNLHVGATPQLRFV
jgi:hypothetical protein